MSCVLLQVRTTASHTPIRRPHDDHLGVRLPIGTVHLDQELGLHLARHLRQRTRGSDSIDIIGIVSDNSTSLLYHQPAVR